MKPSSSPSDRDAGGPGLFGGVLARGPVPDAVSDRAWLRAMLSFESALAAATAPPEAANAIVAACDGLDPDPDELGRAATAHGNPVIPLVEAIRAAVPAPAREYVHKGATSQDVLDTAAMLVARDAVALIRSDVDGAAGAAAGLARTHRDTVMMGRTLLRRAVPVTFGLKAANWLSGLLAADRALARFEPALQLGGAAGTLAAPAGAVADRLGLSTPDVPWHTERSRIAELAGALGLASGAIGKVARDVTLLAQDELDEVSEAAPGASSAMPGKQNPVAAISAIAGAMQAPGLVATILSAMVQEHERAAGAWHAEWRPLRELLISTGSAASWLRASLSGLSVHIAPMAADTGAAGSFVDAVLRRYEAGR